MARIRTIKPEFWSSEQIVECSPTARLLFIGLWNFCDDGGVIPASIKTIKMQIFPGDSFTSGDVQNWLNELINQNLLITYKSDDKLYFKVTGWHHQKIEKPSYKYPKIDENSPTIRRPFADRPPAEGKGYRRDIEGKGSNKANDGEKSPSWPQKEFIEIYDQFVKKIIGVPAKIDGAQIKAGRQIFAYLKNACQQKQGQSDDETVLNSWRYILDNYNRWEPFHQDRTKLIEINSNLQNIAKTLKNGKSTGKNQPATSFDQIDRLAAAVFRGEPL